MLGEWMNKDEAQSDVDVITASNQFVRKVMSELGDVSIMTPADMKKKILFLKYQAKGEMYKSKAESYTRNSGQALFHRKNAKLFVKHHNNLVLLYKFQKEPKPVELNMARKQCLGV
jgi:hypothetical protein